MVPVNPTPFPPYLLLLTPSLLIYSTLSRLCEKPTMLLSCLALFFHAARDLITGLPTHQVRSGQRRHPRLSGNHHQCPDLIDDFELTWADHEATLAMLDDEYVIGCARMFIEHCWELPAPNAP